MDLAHFMPEELFVTSGRPQVRYSKLPASVFDAPFVSHAIREFRAANTGHPSQVFDLRDHMDRVTSLPSIAPSGFVFHVSRCGSTLLSQMLSVLPRNRVLSEPDVMSQYLYHCLQGDITFGPDEFRALLNSYGQAFTGQETSFFVKFTSWNLAFLDQILTAYPAVPWIFMQRDPLEVMVSNFTKPTAPLRWFHTRPDLAAQIAGIPKDALKSHSPEQFLAACLKRYADSCAACLKQFPGGLALSYCDLPDIVPDRVASHFGLSLSAVEQEQMMARGRMNAKLPAQGAFVADIGDKQTQATKAMIAAVQERFEDAHAPAGNGATGP